MILSKARSSNLAHGNKGKLHDGAQRQAPSVPDFKQFLEVRDYKGAITVLQFKRMVRPHSLPINAVLGTCADICSEWMSLRIRVL